MAALTCFRLGRLPGEAGLLAKLPPAYLPSPAASTTPSPLALLQLCQGQSCFLLLITLPLHLLPSHCLGLMCCLPPSLILQGLRGLGLGRVQAGAASLGGPGPTPPPPSLDGAGGAFHGRAAGAAPRCVRRGLHGSSVLCSSGVCLREQTPDPPEASADLHLPLLSWTSACPLLIPGTLCEGASHHIPAHSESLAKAFRFRSHLAPLSSGHPPVACETESNAREVLEWRQQAGSADQGALLALSFPLCTKIWAHQSLKGGNFGLLSFIFHLQQNYYQTT